MYYHQQNKSNLEFTKRIYMVYGTYILNAYIY